MKKLLYLFAFVSLTFYSCEKKVERSLYAELKDIQELSFAEVQIETLGTIKDPDIQFREIGTRNGFFPDILDWIEGGLKQGTRVGVYSFNTTYRAYIDLGELTSRDVEIQQKDKFCRLSLPPVKIKSLGRDFTLEAVYERRSWFRPEITAKEKERLKNKASEKLNEENTGNEEFHLSLKNEAKRKAQVWFATLLSDWGYESEITFKEE